MLSVRAAGLPLDADRGIATKTPGRILTKTRNVLQENAVRNVPTTVISKGRKVVQNTPLQSKVLQTDSVPKDPPGKQVGPSKLKGTPVIRPLGDKTPFPNRTANQLAATDAKAAKPALVDGSLRPSSARKHDRLPRNASKAFETPITDGKHWDVSDIEIEVDTSVANQSIEEESCGEIEYMPPKIEDVPYEPPFEMPNYKEVGKTLMAMIRSYTFEDDPTSTDLTFVPDASESNFFAPPVLLQREIEDDSPFARVKPESTVKPQTSATLTHKSAVAGRATPRLATQRTTSSTRTIAPPSSRALAVARRPTAAPAVRPPITAPRKSSSQPVTRAPTSQSTLRAAPSRATTRAHSVARSTPPVRAGVVHPSRPASISRPATRPAVRPAAPTAPVKGKPAATRPSITTATKGPAPTSNLLPVTGRPRSGTITKEAFESNAHTHIVAHIRSNSLEDVKKDLEGLVVFEDEDEDEEFRFVV